MIALLNFLQKYFFKKDFALCCIKVKVVSLVPVMAGAQIYQTDGRLTIPMRNLLMPLYACYCDFFTYLSKCYLHHDTEQLTVHGTSHLVRFRYYQKCRAPIQPLKNLRSSGRGKHPNFRWIHFIFGGGGRIRGFVNMTTRRLIMTI